MKDFETRIFDLDNGRGHILSARLELPLNTAPKGFGIFANCFTCEKEFFAPKRICRALAAHGIAMVRFDFTGLGKSEGAFSDTNFTTNIQDIQAIIEKIKIDFSADVDLLIGHSFGGAAAIGVAATNPHIKTVATIGSPKDPRHVMRHFEEHDQLLKRDGQIEINVAGRTFILKKQFLEDIQSHDIEQKTRDLNATLFVFHDPEDTMVKYENAQEIFDRSNAEKHLVTLQDAGHMIKNQSDAEGIAKILYNRHIENTPPQAPHIQSHFT